MSILNVQYNVLFIHVPKTAGTSMERCDFLGGGGHWRIRDFRDVKNAFKFAFVRNPWDRFVSAAFHMPNVIGTEHNRDGFELFVKRCSKIDFGAWEKNAMQAYPNGADWPIHHHFLPQWFFLLTPEGEIGVDFVGRFENLQADWQYVCSQIGVPPPQLTHWRKGSHLYYKYYYTPETWDIVGKIYQRDIDLFNYQDSFVYPGDAVLAATGIFRS